MLTTTNLPLLADLVAGRLRTELVSRQMGVSDLAAIANISKAQAKRYWNGAESITLQALEAVAFRLDMGVDDFARGSDRSLTCRVIGCSDFGQLHELEEDDADGQHILHSAPSVIESGFTIALDCLGETGWKLFVQVNAEEFDVAAAEKFVAAAERQLQSARRFNTRLEEKRTS